MTEPAKTISELVTWAKRRLPGELDSELLLAHVLRTTRSHLYTWPETVPKPAQQKYFRELVERRRNHEPMAYLTGTREFWTMGLKVTPDTLIPRPETEHLVEAALQRIPATEPWQIADLGTGCGAIALALASERPNCLILATDISRQALKVAEENARRLEIHNIEFSLGNWAEALPSSQVDLVVSNPPYIAAADPHLLEGDLPFEPGCALIAGEDGMEALNLMCSSAPSLLRDGGWLLLEHGFDQGPPVRDLLHKNGFYQIDTLADFAGHERVTLGQYGDKGC